VNEQIRISPVRVVSHDGEQLGIMPTSQALELARQAELDLVEVAPTERPPVCRIMDFGKFKYIQKKRQHKSAKQHHTQIKEIRVRPKIGQHDMEVKIRRAREFLTHKDKVVINVLFRGRELAHVEQGRLVVEQMVEQLGDVAKVERAPSMLGKRMTAILAPKV
jgi:translation initiation factor IF-3